MRTVELDSVDSTNRAALEAFAASHEPVLVIAQEQTAGRGRLGRSWLSPRGGVWCTLAWGVEAGEDLSAAPLVAGLVVRDAVCRATGVDAARVSIKWPNDLLLDVDGVQKKIAGILCERPDQRTLLVGMGVNAGFNAALLPEGLRSPATTLATALGAPVDAASISTLIGDLLPPALRALASRGFAPFAGDLRSMLAMTGETVSWSTPAGEVRGTVRGIDDQGQLLLETGSGMRALASGEVSRIPERDAKHTGV